MKVNQYFLDFPKELLIKDGDKIKSTTFEEVLKSAPFIGIYFSAHWCPPCRAFTPQLASFYNAVNKTKKEIEIIFVSSDQADHEFNNYYGEMPWAALPYESEDRENLNDYFNVHGIPTLIVFDNEGHLLDFNGRGTVTGSGLAAIQVWKEKKQ